MPRPSTDIEVTLESPGHAVIRVGGYDIAPAVAALTLKARVGEVPTLKLELPAGMFMFDGDDVQVRLAPAQADALVALGWTPPGEVCARADAAEQERDELIEKLGNAEAAIAALGVI